MSREASQATVTIAPRPPRSHTTKTRAIAAPARQARVQPRPPLRSATAPAPRAMVRPRRPPRSATAQAPPARARARRPPRSATAPARTARVRARRHPRSATAQVRPARARPRRPPRSATAPVPTARVRARRHPRSATAAAPTARVRARRHPRSATAQAPTARARPKRPPRSATAQAPTARARTKRPPRSATARDRPARARPRRPPRSATARSRPARARPRRPPRSAIAPAPRARVLPKRRLPPQPAGQAESLAQPRHPAEQARFSPLRARPSWAASWAASSSCSALSDCVTEGARRDSMDRARNSRARFFFATGIEFGRARYAPSQARFLDVPDPQGLGTPVSSHSGGVSVYLTCTVTRPPPRRFDVHRKSAPRGERVEAASLPVTDKVALVGDGGPRSKRTPNQLERSQDAALAALGAVSSYLDSDEDIPSFFARLSATVAKQTPARRAAFWRLGPRGTLALQPAPWGFAADSPVYAVRLQLGARGESVIERLVFGDDLELVKGTCPELDAIWHESGLPDVKNSVAVPWRAGERRIGAVVVYDSRHGFSARDIWVLRLFGMAAGLLWQYKESEDELGHTATRLEEAMVARRHLLNHIAAGGGEARRPFATARRDAPPPRPTPPG